ncbi:hypothetical protein BpHYR1_000708 [Brachionus plicatilis]|uniref:Uncharacterized protein n=1 Tax=Brachionus plicatilis TaxID=10195 RepID=A0A3M7QV36_BRAPC|nr:hypothetical protein BpHYR1_000708 [Brachionus plicatilis]
MVNSRYRSSTVLYRKNFSFYFWYRLVGLTFLFQVLSFFSGGTSSLILESESNPSQLLMPKLY